MGLLFFVYIGLNLPYQRKQQTALGKLFAEQNNKEEKPAKSK